MSARQSATSSSKRSRSAKRAERLRDALHDAMLRALGGTVAELLRAQLQTSGPLNAYLRNHSAEYTKSIESLIVEKKLGQKQAALWREIPHITFADPELPTAKVLLGETLYRKYDQRGDLKLNPEALLTCDIAAVVAIPHWGGIYLRDDRWGSFPKEPLTDAVDGLSIRSDIQEIEVFGNIYPSSWMIGEVAHDLAALSDAIGQHLSGKHSAFADGDSRVLAVTNDQGVFEAFRGRYNVILCGPSGSPVKADLFGLRRYHVGNRY